MVTGLWLTHILNFGFLSWFLRWKEHPHPFCTDLWLWRMLEVPDWGLASWYWFGYGHWSLVHMYSKFWLSILVFKVQRTSMSLKSWWGALEDSEGSWLGFWILILILIGSLVFGTPIFQILALYLDFEGAKNIHVLQVMIWSFGGCWRFLTGGLHPDIDLNMFTGLWFTHSPNFGSLYRLLRWKEHPCSLSPDLGLLRLLEVSDWGLASWSWFVYGH